MAGRTDPRRVALLAGALLWAVASEARAFPAATNYATQCQGCHRASGEGTADIVPRIDGTIGEILARPGGREYLIRVPGVAQAQLDDRELATLLDWVVQRFGGPTAADAAAFLPEEVGRLRRAPLIDVTAARARLFATDVRAGGAAPR